MKPKKVEKKLFLNKKTVADLNNQQMNRLRGGIPTTGTGEVCCPSETCSCETCFTDCNQNTCPRYCTEEKGTCIE
jgi:hypothetical protein